MWNNFIEVNKDTIWWHVSKTTIILISIPINVVDVKIYNIWKNFPINWSYALSYVI